MDYYKLLEKQKNKALLATSAYTGLKSDIEQEISAYLRDRFAHCQLFHKKSSLYYTFDRFDVSLWLHDYFDGEMYDYKEELTTRIYISPVFEPDHKYFGLTSKERDSLEGKERNDYKAINPAPYFFEFRFNYEKGMQSKIRDYDFIFKVDDITFLIINNS